MGQPMPAAMGVMRFEGMMMGRATTYAEAPPFVAPQQRQQQRAYSPRADGAPSAKLHPDLAAALQARPVHKEMEVKVLPQGQQRCHASGTQGSRL